MAQLIEVQTPPTMAAGMSAAIVSMLAQWSNRHPTQTFFNMPEFGNQLAEDLEPDQRVRLSGEW